MEITKEELMAYTEAATKTAAALEKIADRLVDISSAQKNCQEKFCSNLVEVVKTNHELLVGIDKKTEALSSIKWFLFSITGVVGLGMIILEILQKIHGQD